MPNCSVIGCELKKAQNQPTLTMHRLPRCEDKKKKWLEAIGMENIRQGVKDIHICSQHFNENAFNRTLAVVRLRDDAIPSGPLLKNIEQDNSSILESENTEDSNYLLMDQSDSSLVHTAEPDSASKSIQDILELPIQSKRFRKMKQLEHVCLQQRKDIKRLNQIIRRQKKKIADFRNIIKDLLESNLLDNESSVSLEEFNSNDLHAKNNVEH